MKGLLSFIIFIFIFFMESFLFSRPDLIIQNSGDNVYGELNKGGGGSFTYISGENGVYNGIKFTIQNDNDSDSQIYQINAVMPSQGWKYYFYYNKNKYRGEWSTDTIAPKDNNTFYLYIMPPHSTPAQKYHIIINATSSDGSDSCDLYFNVKENAKFDIYYITNEDNLTIGEEIYENNSPEIQDITISSQKCEKKEIYFRIQNIGNIKDFCYLKFVSPYYKSTQFTFFLDNQTITDSIQSGIKIFLNSNEEKVLDIKFNSYNLENSGYFYLELYDSNYKLVDEFRINLVISQATKDYNFVFPKIFIKDPIKYSILVLTNTTDSDKYIDILKDNKFLSQLLVLKNSIKFFPITEEGEYTLKSICPIVPFLIQLDKNYCPINILEQLIFDNIARKIILPLIINANNSKIRIILKNINKTEVKGKIKIFSSNGLQIEEKQIDLKGNETKLISEDDLKIDSKYPICWGSIEADSQIYVRFYNSLFNCYINYDGLGILK